MIKGQIKKYFQYRKLVGFRQGISLILLYPKAQRVFRYELICQKPLEIIKKCQLENANIDPNTGDLIFPPFNEAKLHLLDKYISDLGLTEEESYLYTKVAEALYSEVRTGDLEARTGDLEALKFHCHLLMKKIDLRIPFLARVWFYRSPFPFPLPVGEYIIAFFLISAF